MANDINIKALTKIGKALSGLSEAMELIDGLEASKAALEAEIASRQAALANVNGAIVSAEVEVQKCKLDAGKILEDAKVAADKIIQDAHAVELAAMERSKDDADNAAELVAAAKASVDALKLDEAALSEKVAKLAKTEADILSRIADHKAKLLKALE